MLFKHVFALAAVLAAPLLTSAFPTGAGTCDVNAMAAGSHGASAAKDLTGGVSITTAKKGATYEFTVTGPNAVKGVLMYVTNAKGDRVGSFTNLSKLIQYKACGGGINSTITHNSPDLKTPPLKYTWSSGTSNAAQWTIKTILVQDFKNWYKVPDTTFDLVTGKVVGGTSSSNTTAGANPTMTGADSTSGGGAYGSSASKSKPTLWYGVLYAASVMIGASFIF